MQRVCTRSATTSNATPLTCKAQALDAARRLVHPPEAEAGPGSLEGRPCLGCVGHNLGCPAGASRHQHVCMLVGGAVVQRLRQVQQLRRLALGRQSLLHRPGVGINHDEAAAGAAGPSGNRGHLHRLGNRGGGPW